jgi:hypothetical protein
MSGITGAATKIRRAEVGMIGALPPPNRPVVERLRGAIADQSTRKENQLGDLHGDVAARPNGGRLIEAESLPESIIDNT